MPVKLSAPAPFTVKQGVQVDNGVVNMLVEGDNRWILVPEGKAVYLNTETNEITIRREVKD